MDGVAVPSALLRGASVSFTCRTGARAHLPGAWQVRPVLLQKCCTTCPRQWQCSRLVLSAAQPLPAARFPEKEDQRPPQSNHGDGAASLGDRPAGREQTGSAPQGQDHRAGAVLLWTGHVHQTQAAPGESGGAQSPRPGSPGGQASGGLTCCCCTLTQRCCFSFVSEFSGALGRMTLRPRRSYTGG